MSEQTNDNIGKKTIIKKVKKKKVSELTKSIDNNKRLKTPLRYAGGKSKAIYKLEKCLPKDMDSITEIHDCFLGMGHG